MWRKRGEKVRSAIIRGEKTGTNEKIILGNLLSALAADLPSPLFISHARYVDTGVLYTVERNLGGSARRLVESESKDLEEEI